VLPLHLAAQPMVRRSLLDRVMTYEVNVMGTVNVLEAVRELGREVLAAELWDGELEWRLDAKF
jgi:nucleoside-diphosphate-sugar epimerase